MKTFVLAEVKATDGASPNGAFEAVISAPTLDRDGEVLDAGCFAPLPKSIPIHAFHDLHDPIGRGEPFYDGDLLKVRGVFAGTERAQELRSLVVDGIVDKMSVGFMGAQRSVKDGVPHVTQGELLEASFVSVPSNREAEVTASKSGARNSASDSERLQQIHDLAVANGAVCETKHVETVAAKRTEVGAAITAGFAAGILTPADVRRTAGSMINVTVTEEKSTPTDPEQAAASAPAAPAEVCVARAKATIADALAVLA